MVFEINPLNFAEFLEFHGEERLARIVRECGARMTTLPEFDPAASPARYLAEDCRRYYQEFLVWGGYPRIALERNEQHRTVYLADLYNSYVRKDIKDLARIAIRALSPLENRGDTGELAENAVFGELLKKSPLLEEIGFWRTQSKNEVDFILQHAESIRPVEVKYRPFKEPRIPGGIRSFRQDYPQAEKPLVLTRDFFGSREGVTFLPCWLA